MNVAEVGLELDGLAKFTDRLIELSLLPQDRAEVVVGVAVCGSELNCLTTCGERLLRISRCQQGVVQCVLVARATREESDRLSAFRHCLFRFPL